MSPESFVLALLSLPILSPPSQKSPRISKPLPENPVYNVIKPYHQKIVFKLQKKVYIIPLFMYSPINLVCPSLE